MSTTIVIVAFGTRGDVEPLTGLAVRLRESLGVDVAIAAQCAYEGLITRSGIEFRALPKDTEQTTRDSHYGQAMVDGVRMRPTKSALAGMRDDLAGVGEAIAGAATDADLLLLEGPVGSLLGYHVAEALEIPSAGLMLQPLTATGDFAPPPLGTRSFGRTGNRIAWRLGDAGEKVFTPVVDDLRRTLGLPPRSRRSYQRRRRETWPIINGFSDVVVPRPTDWPGHVHDAGYWWPHSDEFYTPPTELVEFLADGPPPVYVGLGSTATSHGRQLSDTIGTALHRSGNRGVIQRGWAHLDIADDPSIITVDDIPHDWLFPQMAAAVHHCGAGTTAAAVRAGIPTIGVPGIMDQPFWARRLHRLGAGSTPLPRTTMTAEQLHHAIEDVMTAERYTASAHELSRQIRDQDGAGAACVIVEQLLLGALRGTRR